MRKTGWLLVLLVLMPAGAFSAQVSFFIGQVDLARGGKQVAVENGMALQTGDVIKTGADGTVDIGYADGSKISVSPKSSVRIGNPAIKGSDSVSIINGNLSGTFSKLKKGGNKVYTPTMVCAIRGTEFKLSVSQGGDSLVDLREGKLDLNNPYGSTSINKNEKVESAVSGMPVKAEGVDGVASWQETKNEELLNNPAAKNDQYNNYIGRFKDRNKEAGNNVNKYGANVKSAREKDDLEKAGRDSQMAEAEISDDLVLNGNASLAIDGIVNDFRQRGNNIYKQFEKSKKECNKVAEQQRLNYENIQAVKEAYNKAYEEIMGKFNEDKKKIMDGVDFDSVKPKLK